MPGPTLSARTRSASFAAKASYTFAWTKKRFAHTQVWPALRYLEIIAPSAAASRSASSNTTKGALPPSSSESFLIVGATCFISSRPTSVEPVNESLRTTGFAHISPPIAFASPVTTLSTPGGKPARCASSASAKAENGVASAGLITTVQPAASAGATLRVIIEQGKFHGVIAAHTPTGCFRTTRRRSFATVGITSP